MTSKVSDYGSLTDLLDRSGSPLELAELHGGLCGVIAASGDAAAQEWLATVLDDCTSSDADTLGQLDRALVTLGEATAAALRGMALEFEPLLPDDDTAMELRIEALALWCHGFLAGLVVGGLDIGNSEDRLSAETAELVHDLLEISRAGVDAPADADETDREDVADGSLAELIEYVRVGAQLVYEELAGRPGSLQQHTIH